VRGIGWSWWRWVLVVRCGARCPVPGARCPVPGGRCPVAGGRCGGWWLGRLGVLLGGVRVVLGLVVADEQCWLLLLWPVEGCGACGRGMGRFAFLWVRCSCCFGSGGRVVPLVVGFSGRAAGGSGGGACMVPVLVVFACWRPLVGSCW